MAQRINLFLLPLTFVIGLYMWQNYYQIAEHLQLQFFVKTTEGFIVKEPLYIVWNHTQSIDIPILDEQHHAIVAAINSLYFFINQGWGLHALTPTLKIIKANIGFHLKTEEGILEKLGADYKTMRMHEAIFNDFNLNANLSIEKALSEQDPMILLKYLRDWWLEHHIKHHAACKKYLVSIEVKDNDY